MPAVPPYNRQTNFTNFQAVHPATPLPATPLDSELSAVKVTLDALISNLSLIQRADGEIANASIGPAQLQPTILTGISLPTQWSDASVSYDMGDTVFYGAQFYIANAANTSSALRPPPTNAKWTLLVDFSSITLTAALEDGIVTSASIADGAVGSAALADGAVTSAALAAGAVGATAIAASAISSAALGPDLELPASPITGDDSTKIATTAFVQATDAALLAGANTWASAQTFSTSPVLPTPVQTDNSTKGATTAFVAGAVPWASIMAFGGVADGATDNTAALTAAIAAATASGQIAIAFPPGQFAFASEQTVTLSATGSISIFGAGPDVTKLIFASGVNGLTIDMVAGANSVHIRDLSILTGGTGQRGLSINQSHALNGPALSDISNVTFLGSDGYGGAHAWSTAIKIVGASGFNFDNVNIQGPFASISGTGVSLSGSSTVIPILFNFSGCDFQFLTAGISYGDYVQGVLVSECNFTLCTEGIVCPPGTTGGPDELTVIASQFECTTCIVTGALLSAVTISNCLFILDANAVGIDFLVAGLFNVTGNSFVGSSTTGTVGINVVTTSDGSGIIVGNSFYNLAFGVFLQTDATRVNVQSNSYSGTTTNTTDGGTGNTIGGGSA